MSNVIVHVVVDECTCVVEAKMATTILTVDEQQEVRDHVVDVVEATLTKLLSKKTPAFRVFSSAKPVRRKRARVEHQAAEVTSVDADDNVVVCSCRPRECVLENPKGEPKQLIVAVHDDWCPCERIF